METKQVVPSKETVNLIHIYGNLLNARFDLMQHADVHNWNKTEKREILDVFIISFEYLERLIIESIGLNLDVTETKLEF